MIRNIFPLAGYLLLLALTFLLFVFYHSYFMLLLLVLLLLLPVVSIFSGKYTFRRLETGLSLSAVQTDKNSVLNLTIRIETKVWVPLSDLTVSFQICNAFCPLQTENTVHIPILYRGSECTIPFSSDWAGCVKATLTGVRCSDMFHFIRFRKSLSAESHVLVYPDLLPISAIPEGLGGSGQGLEETVMTGQDFSEITDIREYRPGDRLNAIHWKLTAKSPDSALIVKEYEQSSSRNTLLLLELYRPSEGGPDALLDLAYSCGNQLLHMREIFTVCWWSSQKKQIETEPVGCEADLLAAFGRIFYETAYDAPHLAYEQYRSSGFSASGIYYVGPAAAESEPTGNLLFCHKETAALIHCIK